MPDLTQRIDELLNLHWRQQKALADSLGLVKPDSVSWDEFCVTIANAEAGTPAESATTEPITTPEPTPDPITEPLQPVEPLLPIRGNHCPNCNQKLLTGLYGEPICPIERVDCPRNTN